MPLFHKPKIHLYDLIGILVLLIWVTASILLYQSTHGGRGTALSGLHLDGPAQFMPGNEWQGIYLKGEKVGYLHLQKKEIEDGFTVTNTMLLNLSVMGNKRKIHSKLDAELDSNLVLRHFDLSLNAGSEAQMQLSGKVNGLEVEVAIKSAGETNRQTLTLKDPPILDFTVKPLVAQQLPKVGDSFRLSYFDPSILGNRETNLQVIGHEKVMVLGEEVEAMVIGQTMLGVELKAWLTTSGQVVKEELPMGLMAIRETEEEARWGVDGIWARLRRAGDIPDLVQSHTIPLVNTTTGILDTNLATKAVYRLAGMEHMEDLELSGGRQEYNDGILTVKRETLQMDGRWPKGSPENVDALQRPEPFIQSDNPHIQAEVKSIIDGADTRLEAVQRLTGWVYQNLQKINVVGIPSALEVFQNRKGDCNEHAVLLVAMLRAAGYPAQMVVGLTLMEGQFYYHAWVEVYVDDLRLEVDPTTNQVPADVGHLRLVRGGLDKQLDILKVVEHLKEVQLLSVQ